MCNFGNGADCGEPMNESNFNTSNAFVTTRWSAVVSAGRSDSTRAQAALADLCQTYWFPLYAYARRKGHGPEDAEDLTQGFFARLLQLDSLSGLSREKGKFRAFLLASMNHYISDHWSRATAQKRSVKLTLSLDAKQAEGRYLSELSDPLTPERAFERQWAIALLETVVQRLHLDYKEAGKEAQFMELRFAITGEKKSAPYAELAERLGMKEEAVRVSVHRLRQRYRQLLREEIAQTVAEPSEVNDELEYLRRVLAT